MSDAKKRALPSILSFCCLIVALQQTLVVPAVPRFPELVGASATAVSWLVTATLLAGAVATPIFGRLADLFGKREMLLVAMAAVFVGLIIAPMGGIETLIIGRSFQGIGTVLAPIAMTQIRDSLPRQEVPGALAVLSSMLAVGGAIGIPLGGVMLQRFGWHLLFWVSALLSLLSLALIAAFVPKGSCFARGSFDVLGAAFLSIGLSCVTVGISQGRGWGWGSHRTAGVFLAALVMLVVWAYWELRDDSPLVDLRVCFNRPLLFNNIASLLLGIMMFTNLLLTTHRLQNPVQQGGFGWSSAAAGMAMIPTAVIMYAVASVSSAMARALSERVAMMIGAAITAAAYVATFVFASSPVLVIVWTTVISAGVGIGYAILTHGDRPLRSRLRNRLGQLG